LFCFLDAPAVDKTFVCSGAIIPAFAHAFTGIVVWKFKLLKNHQDMTYLSKFAVGTEARGLGIGRDLWTEILKNNSCIFWRSDPEKFITHWYVKQCDGMHKTKNWVVFWKGVGSSQITDAIEYALAQKIDFE
jgi:acetylglutamate synthase